MTKAVAKERSATLFGEIEPPTRAKNQTSKPAPAKPKPEPKQKQAAKRNEVAVRATAKPPTNVAPMNMLAVLANAASDPKCEPAKMRELYAIHKEMAQDQAKIDFIRDFAALQSENLHIDAKGLIVIPAKEGKTGQKTPYAKFNDIMKAIRPLLQKHGFTLSFATEPSTDASRLIVKGFLDHKGGHQRSSAFPLPAEVSGSKNNVQGWGSSMSYGKRYCTIALLNLTSEALEDQDDDGAAAGKTGPAKIVQAAEPEIPKKLTIEQSVKLIAKIGKKEDGGVGLDRFLEKYGVKAAIDLPPAIYADACKACDDYKAASDAARAKKVNA
jgi:hypothetical protein